MARMEANLSQYELADRSGVSRVTIANIERGKFRSARLETLEKLARVLRIPVSGFSDVDMQTSPARDLVDEFLDSPWAAALEPTNEEKAWLRSIQEIQWLGDKPSPESFHHALIALRKRKPSTVGDT